MRSAERRIRTKGIDIELGGVDMNGKPMGVSGTRQ
jgi:hypothetical protein